MSALDELANLDNWRPREQGHGFYHWAYFGNHADVNEAAAELAELRQIADCVDMDECEKRLVELAQLRAELDENNQLLERIAANKTVDYCAYCHKVFDSWDEAEKHINICDKHPMARLRAELDEARKMAYQAYRNRDDTYRILHAYMDAHPEEPKCAK